MKTHKPINEVYIFLVCEHGVENIITSLTTDGKLQPFIVTDGNNELLEWMKEQSQKIVDQTGLVIELIHMHNREIKEVFVKHGGVWN